jgi:hypothetical protein
MSSDRFTNKSVRSHSIHVAIGRDYDRLKMAQKQDIKLEKDFLNFQRRLSCHLKWNQRADSKILNQNPISQERSPMTLEEFMQREKIKHDNIFNAKKLANQNIRRN